MNIKLTVLYEDPFWVGRFERSINGNQETARVIFDTEPKDDEVYDLVLRKIDTLNFH
jgi:hypothetical protein